MSERSWSASRAQGHPAFPPPNIQKFNGATHSLGRNQQTPSPFHGNQQTSHTFLENQSATHTLRRNPQTIHSLNASQPTAHSFSGNQQTVHSPNENRPPSRSLSRNQHSNQSLGGNHYSNGAAYYNRHQDTAATLKQTQEELKAARAERQKDQSHIRYLESKVEELEERVAKQKVTIAHQSKTISTPHRRGSLPFETPPSVRPGSHRSTYDQPPPPFGLSNLTNSVPRGSHNTTVNNTHPLPPKPAVSLGSPPQPLPTSIRRPINSTALVPVRDSEDGPDFVRKFQTIFQETEEFCKQYANVPSVYNDARLDQSIKDTLIHASEATLAGPLMNSNNSRFFLVAKVMNFVIASEYLTQKVVKGFNIASDAVIEGNLDQIYDGKSPFDISD